VAKNLPDGTRNRERLFSVFMSCHLVRDSYGRTRKNDAIVNGLVTLNSE
jgi:hypothetical protein